MYELLSFPEPQTPKTLNPKLPIIAGYRRLDRRREADAGEGALKA